MERDFDATQDNTDIYIKQLLSDNDKYSEDILKLENEISELNRNIDSLKKLELKLENKNTVVIGKSLSESVILLKKNLCEE